jgi:hypothetical protein
MRTMKRDEAHHPRGEPGARGHALALLLAVSLVSGLGCGPMEEAPEHEELGSQQQAYTATNGLAMNGLAMNGLAMNGLAMNGLAMNGLAMKGLSSAPFAQWFHRDPALADMVMTYLVRCALPASQSRTYTSPRTGQVYTWRGSLGLAPGWASGAPANVTEQRVISACLAAHANRFGLHVPISILGRSATGVAIPFTSTELKTYPVTEACFFGNLFSREGVFVGVDVERLDASNTTARACQDGNCAPLVFVGMCRQYCTKDSAGPFYKSCSYKGTSYPPITTRLRQEDYSLLVEKYRRQ